jgi:hypothetical protein
MNNQCAKCDHVDQMLKLNLIENQVFFSINLYFVKILYVLWQECLKYLYLILCFYSNLKSKCVVMTFFCTHT